MSRNQGNEGSASDQGVAISIFEDDFDPELEGLDPTNANQDDRLATAASSGYSSVQLSKSPAIIPPKEALRSYEEELRNLAKIPDVAVRQLVADTIKQNRQDAKKIAEGGHQSLKDKITFWKEDDAVVSEENIEETLSEISRVFTEISQQRQDDNFDKIARNLLPQTPFFEYVKKFVASDAPRLKLLMQAICNYCSFLSLEDERAPERVKMAAENFPPESQYLLCLPATINRVNELFETQACSPKNRYVLDAHQAVLRQYVGKLRNVVYEGNEVHIAVFLEYALGIISSAEAAAIDGNYRSPADEISAQFLIDVFENYPKKFKARVENSVKAAREMFFDAIEDAVEGYMPKSASGAESQEIVAKRRNDILAKLVAKEGGGLDVADPFEGEMMNDIYTKFREIFPSIGFLQNEVGEIFEYLDDETASMVNLDQYILNLPQNFLDCLQQNAFAQYDKPSIKQRDYDNFNFLFDEGKKHLSALMKSKNPQDRDFAIDVTWALTRNYAHGNAIKMMADLLVSFTNSDFFLTDYFSQQEGGRSDLFDRGEDIFHAIKFLEFAASQGNQDAVDRHLINSSLSLKEMDRLPQEYLLALSFFSSLESCEMAIKNLKELNLLSRGDAVHLNKIAQEVVLTEENGHPVTLASKGIELKYRDLCHQFVMRPAACYITNLLLVKEKKMGGRSCLINRDFFDNCAFLAARYGRYDVVEYFLGEGVVTNEILDIDQKQYARDRRNLGRNIFHYLLLAKKFDLCSKFIDYVYQRHINKTYFVDKIIEFLGVGCDNLKAYDQALIYLAKDARSIDIFRNLVWLFLQHSNDEASLHEIRAYLIEPNLPNTTDCIKEIIKRDDFAMFEVLNPLFQGDRLVSVYRHAIKAAFSLGKLDFCGKLLQLVRDNQKVRCDPNCCFALLPTSNNLSIYDARRHSVTSPFIFDLLGNLLISSEFSPSKLQFILDQVRQPFDLSFDFEYVLASLSGSSYHPANYSKILCDWAADKQIQDKVSFYDAISSQGIRGDLFAGAALSAEQYRHKVQSFWKEVATLPFEQRLAVAAFISSDISCNIAARIGAVAYKICQENFNEAMISLVKDESFILPDSLDNFLHAVKENAAKVRGADLTTVVVDALKMLQDVCFCASFQDQNLRENRLLPAVFFGAIDKITNKEELDDVLVALHFVKKRALIFSRNPRFLEDDFNFFGEQPTAWLTNLLKAYFSVCENAILLAKVEDREKLTQNLKQEMLVDFNATVGVFIDSRAGKKYEGLNHDAILDCVLGFENSKKINAQVFTSELLENLREFRVNKARELGGRGIKVKHLEKLAAENELEIS